jgi:hypothetical protein
MTPRAWRLTNVAWLALIAIACSSTPPPPTPAPLPTGTSTSQPTATPETSPTPVGFIHFDGTPISFDYPASWRVISDGEFTGWTTAVAVVGTGNWTNGCVEAQCASPRPSVGPGEIVADFWYDDYGPARSIYDLPPSSAHLLASGLPAVIASDDQSTRAAIYLPGHVPIMVDVSFGPLTPEADRAAIDRLLASIAPSAGPRVVDLERSELPDTSASCIRREVPGRLGRGASGVTLLTEAGDVLYVDWPENWMAREGEDRRFDIYDSTGTVVAREWDQVTLGGRGRGNDFDVCPNGVIARDEFNPATIQ